MCKNMSSSNQLTIGCMNNIDECESSLHQILKNCVNLQSSECLLIEDYNEVSANNIYNNNNNNSNKTIEHCYRMPSNHSSYSTNSSNISSASSYASDDCFASNILEENGRISLAYENLHTIPKRIAEKFAAHVKCLDLSYNNFQNLSFLSFFETLHTLILDRNERLDVNTLPFLPNLRILWINNCAITNIGEWMQRIQMQCPLLEHLSIMGNPGIKSRFSYCALSSSLPNDPILNGSTIESDYREYILHVLPNLEYLDGVARCPLTSTSSSLQSMHSIQSHKGLAVEQNFKRPPVMKINGSMTAQSRIAVGIVTKNTINNNYHANNSSLNNNSSNRHKTIMPLLSFKEIFRVKRRRKSYQSSTTN